MQGRFFSLDGMDGAGKSTQLTLLADWLRSLGRDVVLCRDPGSTTLGESIRQILLDPESNISLRTEMLLYLSARSQLVDEIIKPALYDGRVVLCDRFLLSTLVYQGHAGGLDVEYLRERGLEMTSGLWPDWTIVLDLSPEESIRRRQGPGDRIEQRSMDYHTRVRAGFLAEARRDPERITVFDATHTPEDIHRSIRTEALRAL